MVHKLEPLVFDPATGLPRLPEELAWKVLDTQYKEEVTVTIYEKVVSTPTFIDRVFGDEAKVYWQSCHQFRGFSDESYATEESVKKMAVKIYNRILKWQLGNAAKENLLGLYPPNSLST